VYVVHEAALVPVLKCPLAHALHTRSLVAVPAVITNWPALQVVHAVHVPVGVVRNVPAAHVPPSTDPASVGPASLDPASLGPASCGPASVTIEPVSLWLPSRPESRPASPPSCVEPESFVPVSTSPPPLVHPATPRSAPPMSASETYCSLFIRSSRERAVSRKFSADTSAFFTGSIEESGVLHIETIE
jgi:hypothetical protein